MSTTLLPPFEAFPEEAKLIGQLLAGYATLEIDLMNCVSVVRDDLDSTLKAMFRARGETQRIQVADALGRQHYIKLKLGTEFEMAVGAVKFCMKVRNQYAHCIWYDDNTGFLAFVNLEELAELNAFVPSLVGLTRHHVDVPLLSAQMTYFKYATSLLAWTNFEGRRLAGKLTNQPLAKPPAMKQPLLRNP
ncbi:MAG: hypothetical protein ACKVP4_09850 [Hyphomicrobium sp.]